MRAVAGQLAYSMSLAVAGGAAVVGGVAGVGGPVLAGVVVGAGLSLALSELSALAKLSVVAGLAIGAAAVGGVIVWADGHVELSLPGLVVGAAAGLSFAGASRYAEHVIAVEGPHSAGAALRARVLVPWRDLVRVLSAEPLASPSLSAHPPKGRRR